MVRRARCGWLLLLLVVMVGCTAEQKTQQTKVDTTPEEEQTQVLHASWAKGYGSLRELKEDASLVVVGQVARLASTSADQRTTGAGVATLRFSDFEISVERVLAGSAPSSPVIVHQTGGQVGNQVQEVHSDPLMVVGERYVLFLRRAPDGRYMVLGPEGRFVVRSDQVSSLSKIYPQRRIADLGIDRRPLGEFLRDIEQA